jgi:acetylornithine/succinyldiaminopimelate/putrescine aminotransferase
MRKTVSHASNATLFNADGSSHTDLFGANGTVLLGHSNEAIVAAVREQNEKVWITGRLDSDVRLEAKALVEAAIPESHYLSGFYTTGMEAAEFALRAARVLTGRKDVLGFAKAMHGKSMATAFLAWENPFGYPLEGFHRLPFPSSDQCEVTLEGLKKRLAMGTTAAVFLEAIQGSGGGSVVDPAFCRELRALCTEHDTLLVVDEILTGFHRSGPLFFHSRFELDPDLVLIGKCMGNGFPVSGVVMRRGMEIKPQMLPFSTYAENALAAAAVVGTLKEINRLPIQSLTDMVEARIRHWLGQLPPNDFRITAYGAMCIIDTGNPAGAQQIGDRSYESGVLISTAGPIMRFLPPITIEQAQLDAALEIVTGHMADVIAQPATA